MAHKTSAAEYAFTEDIVKRLVARTVVPPGERDVVIRDKTLPAFFLRIYAGGAAGYGVRFRVGRQQRRLNLGPWVRGGLQTARKLAQEAIANARLGKDVAAAKKEATRQCTTMGDLVPKYLAARTPQQRRGASADDDGRRRGAMKPLKLSTYLEVKRYLESEEYWQPLHRTPIDAIGTKDLVKRLNEIEQAKNPALADAAKRYLSGFFAWCLERLYVKANPALGIRSRAGSNARERTLSEAELAEVWAACLEDDFGRIVKLLILTGQRRGEIADLRWTEIKAGDKLIDLPPERTKNGRPHVVPLSAEALAVLLSCEHWEGRDIVFGAGELRGFSGWSKAKEALDERIALARRKAGRVPIEPWVLHDLRRTFVTRISELKRVDQDGREHLLLQPQVVEAIVNHISGVKGGVAGVYNKALYLDERRKALDAWGAHVAKLVGAGH
jgi:integrase